jgi:hypothetical protein
MEPEYVDIGSTEDAEALSKQRGPWIVANIKQGVGWTKVPLTVKFGGKTLLLLPETEKFAPAVALRADYSNEDQRFILGFLSSLSWSQRGSVTVEQWTGGGHIVRMSKQPMFGQMTAATFKVDYLPAPTDPNAQLALALYHEGASLAYVHVAYSFLSFYKIVNLVSGTTGRLQVEWIRKHAALLVKHDAKKRMAELVANGDDIGEYIYSSCRCAIAHAGDPRNPVVDPHNVEDQKRLGADLPIVIELAEIAIEKELGVKTSQTVYREHRYELSGFDKFFKPEQLAALRASKTPQDAALPALPALTVKLWGHQLYRPLLAMPTIVASMSNGVVKIECTSTTRRCIGILTLNYQEGRLAFDLVWTKNDDGTAAFVEDWMETEQFFWDYNCNGCLEVWDQECIARCDAFIPVNVIMNLEGHKQGMAELQAEAAKRKANENQAGENAILA